MPEITIDIKNKIPTLYEPAEIVTDNTNYTVHFNWDAEWEAIPLKTAIFVSGSGQPYTVIMDGTNSCAVPMITASWGVVYVGLQAGELHTTTACAVRILPSIARQLGSSAPEADRDWWSQIMARLTSPVEKTAAMTQPVGRDADGRLWTAPGGGGGGGGVSVDYDPETGDLSITATGGGSAVVYDDATGNLQIG